MPHSALIGIASLAVVVLVQTAVVAFFLGRLSQRVQTLENESDSNSGSSDRLTRLEVHMEAANASLTRLDNHMQGAQRQLANIAANWLEPGQPARRRRNQRSGDPQ